MILSPPSSKTVGLSLICAALFVAVMPLQIFGREADPYARLYHDAKGSWVPAGHAAAHAPVFFKIAGVTGALGVLLLAFSASSEYRDRRRRRRGE